MSWTNKGYFVVVVAALVSLILVATATTQSYAQNEQYRAKLDGNNEVPPVNTTSDGVINFKTKSGMMTWKMNVTGITDVTGANIHTGKVGENGDIVVDLLKVSKHSDTPKGMIMRGNVTDSSLTGPMAGQTLADLQTAMTNGDTYVNVQTQDHPDGEIRGQVKVKGSNATDSSVTDSTNSTS
jgi:curli biogenesis system outer membrane secretion channel CsgG